MKFSALVLLTLALVGCGGGKAPRPGDAGDEPAFDVPPVAEVTAEPPGTDAIPGDGDALVPPAIDAEQSDDGQVDASATDVNEASDLSDPIDAGATDAPPGDTGSDLAAAACKEPYPSLTRAQLGALTAPAGRCSSARDLDHICGNDLPSRARACGVTCLAAGIPSAGVPGCISVCIQGDGKLSAGCANCYRDAISCVLAKCPLCSFASDSPACRACVVQAGCESPFHSCSGLP